MIEDYKLQARHIEADGKRTTIALELAFWRHLERMAGTAGWKHWLTHALHDRPAAIGKARWARVKLLDKVSR